MVSLLTRRWSQFPDTTMASGLWESANLALYYPISVPTTCVVRRLWWANGTSVSGAVNVDVGVYSDSNFKPATRLVSAGSTAQGTASQVQFVDCTDTVLSPGLYWLAMVTSSSASGNYMRTSIATGHDHAMRMQQSSALPLPSSATPIESTNTRYALFGFSTTTIT